MARDSNTVVARVGLDDRGFQEGVAKIQRSLKVVQSEFAVASSKLGDFGKSTEGLKLKQDNLNKQMLRWLLCLQGAKRRSKELSLL